MKLKKYLPVTAGILLAAGLLARPEAAAQAARDGLSLCVRTVIPSLFPFMTAVSLLLQLGLAGYLRPTLSPFMRPLFGMEGTAALPLLAGLLGGYPAGVRAAAGLYRQGSLQKQEAELLLGFCDNSGPAFFLGFVSAALGEPRAGMWLYLVHAAAALLTGAVLCRLCRDRGRPLLPDGCPAVPVSFARAVTAAVTETAAAMGRICAFVVAFRAAAALLPAWVPGWATGLLEMVSGVAALPAGRTGFVLAAALVGWGGLSVHCQAMAVAEDLHFTWHLPGKVLHAVLSALLALAASPLLY